MTPTENFLVGATAASNSPSETILFNVDCEEMSVCRIAQLDGVEVECFHRIAALAGELKREKIKKDALAVAERIAEGRFIVACIGEFKRGKSTLLNALIGDPILPSGVAPVTTVPTILRYGPRRVARVRFGGDWKEIATADIEQYVSAAGNPENRIGVAAIEVFVPSPLLQHGMCLVDTPGIGSVFPGNTAAAWDFLPRLDAAIVVIGADPPISGDELALVKSVAEEVPDILFVLNKADRVAEREREEAIAFTRQVLSKNLPTNVGTIFEVSAREQLEENNSQRDWSNLVAALQKLNEQSRFQIVQAAARRSLGRLSMQLQVVVFEDRDAMTRPIEESEVRVRKLKEIVFQSEQALDDLEFLFAGAQRRLSKTFQDNRDGFLKSTGPAAHRELDAILRTLPRTRGPRYRRAVMQTAQDVARKNVMPWLEAESSHAEASYLDITNRFTELGNDFLAKARSIDPRAMAHLSKELELQQEFRARSEFQFHAHIELARPASPLRYIADLVLGVLFAHSSIVADAHEFLDQLLKTNSERARSDLQHRVNESRRRVETEIRSLLQNLGATAEGALARAKTAHEAGAAMVESRLKRLSEIEVELKSFV